MTLFLPHPPKIDWAKYWHPRYRKYLGMQILDAVPPSSGPSQALPNANAVPSGKRRHIMTGAGRHAAPYLHHPTLSTPGEGLPVDRFSFLPSAGHRQKRVDSSRSRQGRQAGKTRFAVISPGPYNNDRRRLLSIQTALAAGLEAGSPQLGSVESQETSSEASTSNLAA